MRIYSSRGMFGLSGDCCIDFLGNFTDYDRQSEQEIEAHPVEELSPESEQLLTVLTASIPRRLSGMLQ